jgi:hypothetical protein
VPVGLNDGTVEPDTLLATINGRTQVLVICNPNDRGERSRGEVRTRTIISVAVVVSAVVSALGTTTAVAGAAGNGIAEVPVALSVVNTNTSGAPCHPARPADGKAYTVRGHLMGPRSALAAQSSSPVTLYLFGYEAGEWNWNLKDVAGYDHASEMARLGHVSLTIDELGCWRRSSLRTPRRREVFARSFVLYCSRP